MVSSIIITGLILLILICIVYILYLKYFKKYTRERFAFFAIANLTMIISTAFVQFFSGQGYITAVFKTSNFLFKTNLATYEADYRDYILIIIVLIVYTSFASKIHKDWNGPISEHLNSKRKFHEESGILEESYLQAKDFFHKGKYIKLYNPEEENKSFSIFSQDEEERKPWHESVFELLTLSSLQYKLDLNADYYVQDKVFISHYGTNSDPIAILCSLNHPNDSTIREFVNFCKKQKKQFIKYIVAIKHASQNESKSIKWSDVEIEVLTEESMLDNLVDFSDYKDFICDQFNRKEITNGTGFTLNDIYVGLKGKISDSDENPGDMETLIATWLNSSDNKHLAILGEYGCGKSVLSLKVTCDMLQKKINTNRIPILIELRGKSPRTLNAVELLSTWSANHRIDANALLKLHKAGRLLLIFEGFDEMDMIGDREMRLNHFQRLWEFASPKSKIIITGRPNFFLDDKELKMNLGIQKPFENSPYCEAIHLSKFTIDQIEEALRNVEDLTKQQIIEVLRSGDKNFYDLISRPAILYLVAVIWKERKLAEVKSNITSALVISEFIKYAASRQSEKGINFPLSEKEREYFMLGIAVGMHYMTENANQIHKNDMNGLISKLYSNFPEQLEAVHNATERKRKSLKIRLADNHNAEETVATDIRSCGILVNDLTRKDYFKFAHKSFLEYQASLFFVERLLSDKGEYTIIAIAISKSLEISSPFRHSEETMAFTSEILMAKLNYGEQDPKFICKNLFEILYPSKLLSKRPRIASFVDMYVASPKPVTIILVFLIATFSSLITERGKLISLLGIGWFSVIIGILVVLLFIITFISEQIRFSEKRMLIWLKCCERFNVPQKDINDLVSEGFIKRINKRTSSAYQMLLVHLYEKPFRLP